MTKNPKYLNIHSLEISGKILASSLYLSKKLIQQGLTPLEIDQKIEKFILSCDAKPAFKNYLPEGFDIPYPAATCISVNNQVVHAIPTKTPLKPGDLVTIDIGVSYKQHHTDAARTFIVGGSVDAEKQKLVQTTKEALEIGINVAIPGNRVGHISNAIQRIIHKYKYKSPLGLGGHSIGFTPHGGLFIPNYGEKEQGPEIVEGMCLALEPIAISGDRDIYVGQDSWTILSTKNSLSAHEEDTIVVRKNKPLILTRETLDGLLI